MAGEGVFPLILAGETIVILGLIAFNAYFLVQRPILHYIKEIYFINGRRFRQAWYVVISATTFFLLDQVVDLLGDIGIVIPPSRAQMMSTIASLCFGTLIIVAFTIVFFIFARYVRHLPARDREIAEFVAEDMRRSVIRDDRDLSIDVELSGVGDVVSERRHLGPHVSLSHYRALTTGFIAYMEQRLGHMGDAILYAVGRLTARRAVREILRETGSKDRAVEQIFAEIKEHGIGIPEISQRTQDRVDVLLYESAPAAGAKPTGRSLCHYQAGMLAGVFEAVSERPAMVKETKCWGLGDRLCEFRIDLKA